MIKKLILSSVLCTLLVNMSCQEKYPELDNGLYAEIETTKGIIITKLFFDDVPVTVANFVALAEGKHPLVKEEYKNKPFYDGLMFHRVMNNFMIQGGDPTGSGSGDIGYKFESELRENLRHNGPGVLSMANSGGFATNGSQFFITEKATPWLDGYDEQGNLKKCDAPRTSCHTVFGEVVKGMEVHDSISNVKVGPGSRPVDSVLINKVTIIRKGMEAKKFDAVKTFEEGLPKLKDQIAEAKAEQERKLEEERKVAKEKAKVAKEEWLKKNEELKGRRIDSPTGMAMIFTNEGNGTKPTTAQNVDIDCAGYFENGELFWTTWKSVAQKYGKYDERQDQAGRYAPFSMPYNETATLVSGFREAMLNMKVGDKARVFIPYYLGYGETGRAPLIPPMTNLVFDVEIVGISTK